MRRLHPVLIALALLGGASCDDSQRLDLDAAEGSATARVAERAAAGRVDRYAFAWRTHSLGRGPELLAPDLSVGGGMVLEGTLVAKGYGRTDEGVLVGIQISELQTAELDVFGHNVLEQDGGLVGTEAIAILDDDGGVVSVRVPEDAPALTRLLLAGLIGRVDLRVPTGDSLESQIPVTQGVARASYRREGSFVERQIEALTRIDAHPGAGTPNVRGSARAQYDERGWLHRLDAEDAVLILDDGDVVLEAQGSFTLERIDSWTEPEGEVPSLEGTVDVDPLAPPGEEEAKRVLAERFADGISDFDVAVGIRSAGNGLPPAPGFMVRAVGRLRAWPETAQALVDVFDANDASEARNLVFDLLASAGTPQAQAVMATLLSRPEVQRDPGFSHWVQAWSFVEAPEPASAALLLELDASGSDERSPNAAPALLYPMGTVAARLAERDPVLATLLVERVVERLHATEDRTMVTAALAGLGNAGRTEDFATIVPYLQSPDAQVRATATIALRFSGADEAMNTMFDMLDDEDSFVAASALSALVDGREDTAAALSRVAIEGHVHPEIASSVGLHLLRVDDLDPALARAALQSLASVTDAEQRATIDRWIGEFDRDQDTAIGN